MDIRDQFQFHVLFQPVQHVLQQFEPVEQFDFVVKPQFLQPFIVLVESFEQFHQFQFLVEPIHATVVEQFEP